MLSGCAYLLCKRVNNKIIFVYDPIAMRPTVILLLFACTGFAQTPRLGSGYLWMLLNSVREGHEPTS